MAHVWTQMRGKIITVLKAAPAPGYTVFDSKAVEVSEKNLPSINVSLKEETTSLLSQAGEVVRETTFLLELTVKNDDEAIAMATADDLCVTVESRLAALIDDPDLRDFKIATATG